MTTDSLDIFDGVTDNDTSAVATGDVENVDVATENDEATDSETTEAPVETVAEVPDGAMSVTEFAAYMTQQLMKAKIMAGEDAGPSDYVVPQAVYQTVKALRDRIPHILVKGADDAEARVYIKRDEAVEWWTNRKDRLSTRGTGASRASSRSAEDNQTLLHAAVVKNLYANSRLTMWTERVEQSTKLVDKYKGFLSDQSVPEETVALIIQEATDAFNTEQAEKAAKKAKEEKKSGATTEDNE